MSSGWAVGVVVAEASDRHGGTTREHLYGMWEDVAREGKAK
jgi:hypothetical protein